MLAIGKIGFYRCKPCIINKLVALVTNRTGGQTFAERRIDSHKFHLFQLGILNSYYC